MLECRGVVAGNSLLNVNVAVTVNNAVADRTGTAAVADDVTAAVGDPATGAAADAETGAVTAIAATVTAPLLNHVYCLAQLRLFGCDLTDSNSYLYP